MIRHLILFIIIFCWAIGVIASPIDLFTYASPIVKHFTKKDYKGGNQNWSMTQDENGFVYVGNSNGLLQFDGIRWKKFALPNGSIVRAVFADGNRIYTGSLGDFGYWEMDENYNLHYTSISKLLMSKEFGDEEIWWIVKYNNRIFFQSFGTTYAYDGKSVEIVVSNLGLILPPFVVNGQMYVQSSDSGLYTIGNGKPSFVPGSELLKGKSIQMMETFSDSYRILIGTEKNGLYIMNNNTIEEWKTTANTHLITHVLNRGIKISDQVFAIGTILGGVFIINEDGQILSQINSESGLSNNTVLSFLLDKKNNLWVGLDNGIDLLKINSPQYSFSDVTGNIGSVYTAVIHEGTLFLGTNRGVFYKKFLRNGGPTNNHFTLIPDSQGQVWTLSVIDNTLFCGHNNSTYIIKDHTLNKISNVSGGYSFILYPYNSNYLVQGAYNGLFVYKKENGDWKYSHSIAGFNKLSKILAFERANVLWVSHPYKGLYRMELSDNLEEVKDITAFSAETKTYINILNNKIVFSSDSGFVYYDDIQNSFFELSSVNDALGEYARNAHLLHDTNDRYWIFKEGECVKVVMDEKQVFDVDGGVANNILEFIIPGHENIYVMDSMYTFLLLDNGFAVFNNSWVDLNPEYKPEVLLREINFLNNDGEKLSKYPADKTVPFRYNHVAVQVAYPEFALNKDLLYKLEGYNEHWMRSEREDEIVFQNLPFGKYTLKIKPDISPAANELSMDIVINPPFYKSALAQVFYIVMFISLLSALIILQGRKIKRIQKRHELERRSLLEREAAENERKLAEIRNENLRNEIKLRNSKLAKSTFSLIHKNSTLIMVKQELTKIKDELGVRLPSKHFNRLVKSIDDDLSSEKDWGMFEQSFSDVHENFLQKLKGEYPDLTPADIQLCAYLKMNLSSKEIASLLNITIRGVEIRRYRLRKKLHMEHDKNLVEFIMAY